MQSSVDPGSRHSYGRLRGADPGAHGCSPTLNALVVPKHPGEGGNIALGYVRREANQIGNELTLRTASGESPAKIIELPLVK